MKCIVTKLNHFCRNQKYTSDNFSPKPITVLRPFSPVRALHIVDAIFHLGQAIRIKLLIPNEWSVRVKVLSRRVTISPATTKTIGKTNSSSSRITNEPENCILYTYIQSYYTIRGVSKLPRHAINRAHTWRGEPASGYIRETSAERAGGTRIA